MAEIFILQPGYAHYRDQLFAILSQGHNIHVIYERSTNLYPGSQGPASVRCTYLDKRFKNRMFGLVFYLLRYRPEIVISPVSTAVRSLISYAYATLFRKRFILWLEEWRKPTYPPIGVRSILGRIRARIGAEIIVHSDALIAGGSAAYKYSISLGKNHSDVFLALQAANDQQSKATVDPSIRTRRGNKFTFLYLARILPWKGLDILIKSFYLLSRERTDVALLIAGDGPFRQHCEQMCKSLNLRNIEYIGNVRNESTWKVYREADVFVLPSCFKGNEYEAWGLVINEAMSSGLPVITTTAVGASYDMVFNGYNGFVVQSNDVFELYEAMKHILQMDIAMMGRNSRKIFTAMNNFKKMAEGFGNAIVHVRNKTC